MKFYKCDICGNLVTHLSEEVGVVSCCGEDMVELTPNTVDAAVEKHVPVYTVNGNEVSVKVGEVAHPMLATHYITAIAVETNKGKYIKKLSPETPAEATFILGDGETVVAVYEYCNLHGLWKA